MDSRNPFSVLKKIFRFVSLFHPIDFDNLYPGRYRVVYEVKGYGERFFMIDKYVVI